MSMRVTDLPAAEVRDSSGGSSRAGGDGGSDGSSSRLGPRRHLLRAQVRQLQPPPPGWQHATSQQLQACYMAPPAATLCRRRRCTARRAQAVLVPTATIPDTAIIKGHDFDKGRDLDALMGAMLTSGFQATALGQAVEEVNRMVRRRARPGWAAAACAWRRRRRQGACTGTTPAAPAEPAAVHAVLRQHGRTPAAAASGRPATASPPSNPAITLCTTHAARVHRSTGGWRTTR